MRKYLWYETLCQNISKLYSFPRRKFNFSPAFPKVAWLTPNCDETIDMQPFHEFLKSQCATVMDWIIQKKGPNRNWNCKCIDFTEGQISYSRSFFSLYRSIVTYSCLLRSRPDCTFATRQHWHMRVIQAGRIIKFSRLITFWVFLCANNSHCCCRCMGEGAWKKGHKNNR